MAHSRRAKLECRRATHDPNRKFPGISTFAGHANGIDGSEAFLPDDMKGAREIVVLPEAAKAGVFLPVCPEPVNELYTAIWAELTK